MKEENNSISPNIQNIENMPETTVSIEKIALDPTQSWQESQYFQLKSQIDAYKYLYHNLEIPFELKPKIYQQSQENWEKQRKFYSTANSLFSQYHDFPSEVNDFLSKISTPDQLKIYDPKEIHEKVIEQRRAYFQENLIKVLSRPDLSKEQKLEFQIFEKMLALQDFQKKLREKVFKGKEAEFEKTEFDKLFSRNLVQRASYIRPHEILKDKREEKIYEKYEQRMRTWQREKETGKHKKFIEDLLAHYKEFADFHKKKQLLLKKRVTSAKTYFDNQKKRAEEAENKNESERMKMLEAGEMDKYLEMINSAKNKRVLEILCQTNKYLEQLGAKVEMQKQANMNFSKEIKQGDGMALIKPGSSENQEKNEDLMEESKNKEITEEDQKNENMPESEKIKKEIKSGTKMYYTITHTIKEDITEGPMSLKGGKLKNYQLQGLQWLVSLYNNNLNGILADEMGLGKTIQTIALLSYLIDYKNNDGPYLIVVPLSTVTNWTLEFEKWAPHIKRMVYKGDPNMRKQLATQMRNEKFHVVLTTYEYIIKDKSTLNRIAWQYIIVDEGHRMKNSKCKFAMILGQNYQSAHRLLLTGTPLQNNLAELWALLNFLLPKIFAASEDFEKWFNRPFAKIGAEKNIVLNEEERLLIINRLHQVLRPFLLRRMKKEVEQELPNKIEYVIRVDLSGWQKIFYKQLKETGILARDPSTNKIGKRSLMNTMMQLRKICNHPYLFLSSFDSEFLKDNIYRCSGKFELLDRILPKLIDTGHKILIFSQMTQLMDIMQIYFAEKKIPHLRLDGNTKVEDRGQCTALFNAEKSEYKIFLLSTRAGGQGLNLQAADTVILFDSDFNPQMDLQAQDRAHRIGQKHEVRVYRLVTNTKVEEEILSRAAEKKNIDNVVIQAGLFNQKASDIERQQKLENLLKQDEKEKEEDDEEIVPDDDQINEYLARNETELKKFQQMDLERYTLEKKDEKLKEIAEKLKLASLPQNLNYRLMQEYEVPEWVTHVQNEEKKTEEIGKRVTKRINYAEDEADRALEEILEESDSSFERNKLKRKKVEENNEEIKENMEENLVPNLLDDDKKMIEIEINKENKEEIKKEN